MKQKCVPLASQKDGRNMKHVGLSKMVNGVAMFTMKQRNTSVELFLVSHTFCVRRADTCAIVTHGSGPTQDSKRIEEPTTLVGKS